MVVIGFDFGGLSANECLSFRTPFHLLPQMTPLPPRIPARPTVMDLSRVFKISTLQWPRGQLGRKATFASNSQRPVVVFDDIVPAT